MAKLSRDLTTGTLHPRENIAGAGALGALNAEIVINADGASTVALDLRGTFNLTVEVAGSVDGTNWTLLPCARWRAAPTLRLSRVLRQALGWRPVPGSAKSALGSRPTLQGPQQRRCWQQRAFSMIACWARCPQMRSQSPLR